MPIEMSMLVMPLVLLQTLPLHCIYGAIMGVTAVTCVLPLVLLLLLLPPVGGNITVCAKSMILPAAAAALIFKPGRAEGSTAYIKHVVR